MIVLRRDCGALLNTSCYVATFSPEREIKMKPLFFAATLLALSCTCTLIVMVSAQQCDLSAASTCTNNFTNMVSKDIDSMPAVAQITICVVTRVYSTRIAEECYEC